MITMAAHGFPRECTSVTGGTHRREKCRDTRKKMLRKFQTISALILYVNNNVFVAMFLLVDWFFERDFSVC